MLKSASIVLFAGATALAPAAAEALPLGGPALVQRVMNAEFRGYTRTSRGFENQIWHFLPDGRIRAVGDARTLRWGREDHLEWQDIGSWRVEGDRLCVGFRGVNQNLAGCYAIDVGFGKNIRLVGPYLWEGTLERYE
jgi:hypothetical protein